MILYFVEFLAYIEIVKSDFPQTSQFFKKDDAYSEKIYIFEQTVLF